MKLLLLIALGASIGAIGRWGLSIWLNPLLSQIEFGTLIANCVGCFLMGMMMAILFSYPTISTEWRVFIMTGFLGSLTTFSSFSGEVVSKMMSDKWLNALSIISLHLILGFVFTIIGFWIIKLIF